MRKIGAVALKELRQASRDPLSLLLLLGMPAMMLLLYGYAVNFDVRHVRLALEDLDRSAASRDLIASFVNSTYFDLVADLPAGTDFDRIAQRRVAKAILVIPERFSDDLAAGRTAKVQLILDGTDANTATTVLGYASGLVTAANVRLARGLAGGTIEAVPIGYEPRVWYNPELKSTLFLIPGLIGLILTVTAVLSTALSVVREKERGTMEQLRVTSLRPGEMIAGKTLPYLGISLAATVVILVAGRLLFGLTVRGAYLDLFLATFLYLIGALGWGLLVSSFAGSQAMAFQVGFLTSMLPAIFLSGFIFTIRSMPPVIQAITRIVPARYYLVILRGVILKGAGLGTYLPEMSFLALFASVVMGVAWVRLVRREV
jgi:ABC-2 type transport system permease protein